MLRFTPLRTLSAVALFVGLILVWAEVSAAWVGVARGVALALARGAAVSGSPGASVVLPVVCGSLVVVDLTLRRRVFWLCAAVAVSFGMELVLVAVWAATGAPPELIVVPGDAVQVVLPIAVLAIALSEARRTVWGPSAGR